MRPEHLLDQSAQLIGASRTGQLRQADKKRAVSTAYYALFHAVLTAVADQLIGRSERGRPAYTLAYRSIDHRRLRSVCDQVSKSRLSPTSLALRVLADAVVSLGEMRTLCDYDPSYRISLESTKAAVADARGAVDALGEIVSGELKDFAALLAFGRARS